MSALDNTARLSWLGASESYKVIQQSKYDTLYDVAQEKRGVVAPADLSRNLSVQIGQALEPWIIANAHLFEATPWEHPLQNRTEYWVHPDVKRIDPKTKKRIKGGMGCSPDTIGLHPNHPGWGPVDIKVSKQVTLPENGRDYWYWQIQHQIACWPDELGPPPTWGGICALIYNANGFLWWHITWERNEDDIQTLVDGAQNFWDLVDSGVELDPADYPKPSQIKITPPPADLIILDLADETHARVNDMLGEMFSANRMAAEQKKHYESLRDKVVELTGGASLRGTEYEFTRLQIEDNPGKPITAEMVGDVIGARKGYVRQTLKERKT